MIPAPDGFQYGVMFVDGSVRHDWNGSTQRWRAEEFLRHLRKEYKQDGPKLNLVRRRGISGMWIKIPLRARLVQIDGKLTRIDELTHCTQCNGEIDPARLSLELVVCLTCVKLVKA